MGPHCVAWLVVTRSAAVKRTDETHEVAARKLQQMDKLKAAFGLSDVKEGDAFNRELQVGTCKQPCRL